MRSVGLLLIVSLVVVMGCLDPYEPPKTNQQTSFLVIEGHINSTSGIATVQITRSIGLTDEEQYPEVSNANVAIEYDNNKRIQMKMIKDGNYSVSYPFNRTTPYRLRVVISGRGYLSDYINLEGNSPIESVEWDVNDSRFEVYANTADATEGFKYYRYTFDETYEYLSPFHSAYKFENGVPTLRLPGEDIHTCWLTSPSTGIILASTENLTENRISRLGLIRIPKGDKRLWRQYSILVRQYSISKDAFDYWNQIRRTSESVGGLFDPMPYQINGNIRALSSQAETVLGYFSGGDISEKRIVVRSDKLPPGYIRSFIGDCDESLISVSEVPSFANLKILLTRPEVVGLTIVGYYYSSPRCVDCRLEGGTTLKPDFMD